MSQYPTYITIKTTGDISGAPKLEVHLAMILREYLEEIWVHKQASYGLYNISALGKPGLHTRMLDKLERVKQFNAGSGCALKGDAEEDAWFDLLGYAAMGIMLHRNLWPQPSRWYKALVLVRTMYKSLVEIIKNG